MSADSFLKRLARELKHGILPLWTLEELSAHGETYGYALMERLRERGGPEFRVAPSNLYSTLGRLKRLGLVESFHGKESRGPIRKYYRLTEEGRSTLGRAVELAARLRAPEPGARALILPLRSGPGTATPGA
jgi:PadR family transcriptional regulator, regulatory protein PadR